MVDARSKIITHYLSGNTPTEILKKLKHEKVNRMLVYRTIKRYKETSGITDKARSGKPPTARSIRLRKAVRSRVARNHRRSMRKMAKELEINRESLRKLVHQDLGLKSLKRKTVHHLTPSIRQKRLERCKGFLRRLGTQDFEKILFSDEKLFTVEEATNRQNDRILSTTAKDIPEEVKFVDRVQEPQSVMVCGGVTANSRTNLIFIPKGVKINSETYWKLILEPEVKDAGRHLFKTRNGYSNRTQLQRMPQMRLSPGSGGKISSFCQRRNGHLPARTSIRWIILCGVI
ncbi:MhmaT1 transposase [Oopsacas minuta]|uniref:MhmaT1 transposase n=1 Tax=Oopsacas minuta TaxID=111878 RepID=A0AAV7JZ38_9METZ|nr:MhmaT1 transposase [Oopsacas minuta]